MLITKKLLEFVDYHCIFTLFIDQQEKYPITLSAMDEEASKFGLHVSWSKTKIQNLNCGPALSPVMVNGNIIYRPSARNHIPGQHPVEQ